MEGTVPGVRSVGCGAVVLSVLLAGCSEIESPSSAPPEEAPVRMTIEEVIALIEAATPNSITAETVAETFAFGTNATDVQREMMKKELVGSVVEWDLVVYDVEYAEGKYEVTSQPIQIQSSNAWQLVSVVAWVRSRGSDDDALLRRVQTDDLLRIRGVVQGIRFRTVVMIGPAVVVGADQ